jgi:hypothetical protein
VPSLKKQIYCSHNESHLPKGKKKKKEKLNNNKNLKNKFNL